MSGVPLGSKWLIVAAVGVAVLAGAGVAIAAGLGAFNESNPFNGISAAQHRPTAADKLAPDVAATWAPDFRRDAGTVRFLSQLRNGARIYAVARADGELCSIAESLPGPTGPSKEKGKPTEIACNMQLSQKEPITWADFGATWSGLPFTWGFALDNVTAVSFGAGAHEVTLPVKNNVWAYAGGKSMLTSVTAHFADGSTRTIHSCFTC
jgi:hypothetical protein